MRRKNGRLSVPPEARLWWLLFRGHPIPTDLVRHSFSYRFRSSDSFGKHRAMDLRLDDAATDKLLVPQHDWYCLRGHRVSSLLLLYGSVPVLTLLLVAATT